MKRDIGSTNGQLANVYVIQVSRTVDLVVDSLRTAILSVIIRLSRFYLKSSRRGSVLIVLH